MFSKDKPEEAAPEAAAAEERREEKVPESREKSK